MSELKQGIPRVLHRILHPTDFTSGSERAFEHSLKLALVAKGDHEGFHLQTHRAKSLDRAPAWALQIARQRLSDRPRAGSCNG